MITTPSMMSALEALASHPYRGGSLFNLLKERNSSMPMGDKDAAILDRLVSSSEKFSSAHSSAHHTFAAAGV